MTKHEKIFKGVRTIYHSIEYRKITINHSFDGFETETKIQYNKDDHVSIAVAGDVASVEWGI